MSQRVDNVDLRVGPRELDPAERSSTKEVLSYSRNDCQAKPPVNQDTHQE